MKFSHGQIVSIFAVTLCAVCLVLAVSLFYLLVPHLEISKSDRDAQIITDQIIATTSADFAIFWQLNLPFNSQRSTAMTARHKDKQKPMQAAVSKLEQVKLSAAHTADEFHTILGGRVWCSSQMPTSTTISIDSKNYFQENPERYVCFVPVINKSNALTGKVTVIWQKTPTEEDMKSALVQIKGIAAN